MGIGERGIACPYILKGPSDPDPTNNLPAHIVKGGTTVSGGSTELSAIALQSFMKLLRPITTFFPDNIIINQSM